VVTPDEIAAVPEVVVRTSEGDERRFGRGELQSIRHQFDWDEACSFAADGTQLQPGDVLAGPASGTVDPMDAGIEVEIEFEFIGTLWQTVR